jgi:hypothetical protein
MHVDWKQLSSVILIHLCVVNSNSFFNSLIFFFLFPTGDADSQCGSVIFFIIFGGGRQFVNAAFLPCV